MAISRREKMLVLVAGALGGLFLVYQTGWVSVVRIWKAEKARADALETELIRHQVAIRQRDLIEERYKELEESIRQEGTDEEVIAEFLEKLSNMRERAALMDKGTYVLPVEVGEVYRKVRIKMQLEGSMVPLADFLYSIVMSGEPLRIERLDIRAIAGQQEYVRAEIVVGAIFAGPTGKLSGEL